MSNVQTAILENRSNADYCEIRVKAALLTHCYEATAAQQLVDEPNLMFRSDCTKKEKTEGEVMTCHTASFRSWEGWFFVYMIQTHSHTHTNLIDVLIPFLFFRR